MKNKLLLLITFIVITTAPVLAQVTIGSTAQPNAGALLDLNNVSATTTTYRGVLLPQVTLSATAVYGLNTAGSAAAVDGMLVYNTVTVGTGATAVIAGTYIWQGSVWNLVNVGVIAGDNLGNHTTTQNLNLQGNSIIGTADTLQNGGIGIGITRTGGINIGSKADSNIFIGAQAGLKNVYYTDIWRKLGNQNTFIGIQSGYNNYGSYNVFSGHQSGYKNRGDYNVFSGYESGYNNEGGYQFYGSNNVFTGYQSGKINTWGSNNVFVGSNSGNKNTWGFSNTAIGKDATPVGKYNSYYNFYYDLVNTTSLGFGAQAYLDNTIKLGNDSVVGVYSSGAFYAPYFQQTSDARLKYNIQANVPGLAFINKLRPVTYRFDTQKLNDFTKTGVMNGGFHELKDAKTKTGFLAQEVEVVAKETGFDFDGVHAPEGKTDVYSLGYAQFVMPLVKAVQELNGEVEILKAENASLKAAAVVEANSKTGLLKRMERVEELLNAK